MLTCPCNVYPLTPHFYIVKLGFHIIILQGYTDQGSPSVMQHVESVESSSLLLHRFGRDLCVYRDDSLTSLRVIMRNEQPTKCFVPLQLFQCEVGAVKLV